MLTTFNEVDMSAHGRFVPKYKDKFKEAHGVNPGFMSFYQSLFYALLEWLAVNAYIDGESIIYHEYCDISIASAPKGLVVPVIRNAESLSMGEIGSQKWWNLQKAKDNKLTIEEMTGGRTFTITNGGIFGSMGWARQSSIYHSQRYWVCTILFNGRQCSKWPVCKKNHDVCGYWVTTTAYWWRGVCKF